MMRGWSRDSERGAGTLENLGIASIAVLLVGAVVLGITVFPGRVSTVFCQLAQLVGGGSAASCEETAGTAAPPTLPTDEDFRPPACMLSQTSSQYSAAVKVWFVQFGQDSGFIVQQFAAEDGGEDGPVQVTLTDGASIGANGAVSSSTFDAGKLGNGDNAGLEVSLGADLKFAYGSTWQFDNPQQWQDMERQLNEYLVEQEAMKHSPYYAIQFLWKDPKQPPKDPSISMSSVGLELAASAAFGLREPTGALDADGNPEFFDPNVGVDGEIKLGTNVILQTDHDKKERTWTFELKGSGSASGSFVAGEAQAQGELTGAMSVTRGENGELTQISLQHIHEGGFSGSLGNDSFDTVSGEAGHTETSSSVVTTTLDVTDQNRATVEAWLSSRQSQTAAMTLPFSAMIPDKPSDDPFEQLMYEQAKVSSINYHNVKDAWEFELAVKKGWELGFNIGGEEATATAVDAEFLGAPGTDGTRSLLPDDMCVVSQ
ncbi:hypothetical protein DNL40_14745 [Xylanimonas oleitrophica]|uniref:Uncharacterized protein n=2 Tax=Xylanimonas oleitrophica TaxID=2607479 RepID=A0A2W5WUF7_9MICO|nr:hypothetical protein DNL40_14745 [Xylanimonas oleitrophica]